MSLQALAQVRTAQRVLLGLCAAAFLGFVTFLSSRGCQVLSPGPLASAAILAAGAAAISALQRLEKRFVFTDWVNAEK